MRFYLFLALILSVSPVFSQQTKDIHLRNALVVGQLDKAEDRFTMEINLTQLLAESGIKAMASLNVLKEGTPPEMLASDSIQAVLKAKGIDTYVLVSVRGYDRKFKPSKRHESLVAELASSHLFPIYRDEISSVTFEFKFYRNGEFAGYDLIKVNGVGSRETVLKKFRKAINKRLAKSWR